MQSGEEQLKRRLVNVNELCNELLVTHVQLPKVPKPKHKATHAKGTVLEVTEHSSTEAALTSGGSTTARPTASMGFYHMRRLSPLSRATG